MIAAYGEIASKCAMLILVLHLLRVATMGELNVDSPRGAVGFAVLAGLLWPLVIVSAIFASSIERSL